MFDEWELYLQNPIGRLVYHPTFGIGAVIGRDSGYYIVQYAKYENGREFNCTMYDIRILYDNLCYKYHHGTNEEADNG